jgi:hypothetical protein
LYQREILPLFVAVHKWKPEDELVIAKESIALYNAMLAGTFPEGVKIDFSYSREDQGAYCVWEATSKDALERVFDLYAPTLKKFTEFVPVKQAYPPTMEYVIGLGQQLILTLDALSK